MHHVPDRPPDIDLNAPAFNEHRLFGGERDFQHNAVVDDWSCDAYPAGYKQAADKLVAAVPETLEGRDELIIPIVFLYRQYLELRMKDIITAGNELFRIENEYPRHHELNRLWQECRPILERLTTPDWRERFEQAEQDIYEFHQHDRWSDKFRFPRSPQGNLSIPREVINLRRFRNIMEELATLLDPLSEDIFNRIHSPQG